MKKTFINLAIVSASLLGCATNNGPKYRWIKTFESNVGFEQAKAQCDYENHLQSRADRRADVSNSSLTFALLGIVDPTTSACMRRFGYDTVPIEQNSASSPNSNTNVISATEKERIETLNAAASKGDVSAEVNLAYSYLTGKGVSQSYEQAFRFYTRAAPKIDKNKIMAANAQVNLGNLYEEGLGVRKNIALALMWYSISASNGEYEGLKRFTELKKKASNSDVIESEKLQHICIEKELRGCDAAI